MSLDWHGDAIMQATKEAAAEGLLAAAVFFENTLRQKVSVPSPFYTVKRTRDTRAGKKGTSYRVYYDPSRPGEYPKLRTGLGRNALTHQPETRAEVVANGYVRVGYVYGDHHLLMLEMEQDRKGLIDLLDELRPQLSELATAAFKNEASP